MSALRPGGNEWTRVDGTRPTVREHRQASRKRGAAISGANNHARAYGGRVRVPENRGMGDDYAAIVTYDAASARRMARLGFSQMEFERGELPPGVKVWVK